MTELLLGTRKGLFALEGEPGSAFEVTARAFAGEPVRSDASPSRRVRKPSRPSANSIRALTDAQPSPAPRELTIAATSSASAIPDPT